MYLKNFNIVGRDLFVKWLSFAHFAITQVSWSMCRNIDFIEHRYTIFRSGLAILLVYNDILPLFQL